MSRAHSRNYQSPGLANSAKGAYLTQLNRATGGNVNKRALSSDDTVVYELMRAQDSEQAHHRAILETLTPLYKGLNEGEAAELTAYLNQYGATGNNILNLINLPQDIHQSGIHEYAIKNGYQYHPNYKPTGHVRDILDASEMPLSYRKHVGMNYMTKAVPDMNDYINELLTHHPSMKEALDMSSVKAAKEAEAQKYKDAYMDGVRTSIDESGEGDNRAKAMVFKNEGDVIIEGSPRLNGNGKNGH